MGTVEIQIKGQLDQEWSAWFDDLKICYERTGTTIMKGIVQDQSALYGLIAKLRDLGLPLVYLNYLDRVSSSVDECFLERRMKS